MFERPRLRYRSILAFGISILLPAVGCDATNLDRGLLPRSKLAATGVIIPAQSGHEISNGAATVSVPAGAFLKRVKMNVLDAESAIQVETETLDGDKVSRRDVLKDIHYCLLANTRFEQMGIIIVAQGTQDGEAFDETILSKDVEITDVETKSRVCWNSRIVNGWFTIKVVELADGDGPVCPADANAAAIAICKNGNSAPPQIDGPSLPSNTVPAIVHSCPSTLLPNTPFSCLPSASDPDIGTVLKWSLAGTNTCGWASINSASGTISGMPNSSQIGKCTLAFFVSDGMADSDVGSITITVNALPPPNPTSLAAGGISDNQIDLSWTSGGESTADFRISYLVGDTAPDTCAQGAQIGEALISGSSHSIAGLVIGTSYSFRICAINGNFLPDVSSGITVTATTTNSTVINWVRGPDIFVTQFSQTTFKFEVSGGTPPYAFSIVANSGGGAIDATTGVYTAGTLVGTDTIKVEDSLGVALFGSAKVAKMMTNGRVSAQTYDGSGGLFVVGTFTSVHPEPARNLAKISSLTGDMDPSFSLEGFDNQVFAIANLPDGSFVVGGSFLNYRGLPCARIAKIRANGKVDTTFDMSTGFDGAVNAIVYDSGSLYVGGAFTNFKGSPRQYIAKLNASTGELDTSFDSSAGFSGQVHAVIVQANSVYAAGVFTTYKGTARGGIAKLNAADASLDTTFDSASGITGATATIYTLALNSGSIYAGGSFTAYKSTSRLYLAKIDASTAALDTNFNTFPGFAGNSIAVRTVVINSGSVYVAGNFSTYKGSPALNIAKLDANTAALNTTFSSNANMINSFTCFTLALEADSIYAGFANSNTWMATRVVRIDSSTGTLDATFASGPGFGGPSPSINVILPLGGNIYVGGNYASYKGLPRHYFAKFNESTGAVVTTFDTSIGFDKAVTASIQYNAGHVYIGGSFLNYNGSPIARLAKINSQTAALDPTFNPGTGFSNSPVCLLYHSGFIYAGGNFTSYNGTSREAIAKINATTGALDPTFDSASGFTDPTSPLVYSLLVDSGSVYVGGYFYWYKGISRKRIAKLNATTAALDTTFDPGLGFDGPINDLALDSGYLYTVGNITDYNGSTRRFLAKLNATNASLDTTYDPLGSFTGGTATKIKFDSGFVYVSGNFGFYQGNPASKVAKLFATTAALDTTFDTSGGVDGNINSMEFSLGNFCLGGSFFNFSGTINPFFVCVDPATAVPVP